MYCVTFFVRTVVLVYVVIKSYVSIENRICLSVRLTVCLSVCLPVFVCVFACLYVCVCVCDLIRFS